MPNTKTATKESRKSIRRNAVNKARMSRIRTFIRKMRQCIAEGNVEVAMEKFKTIQSEVTRGVNKGVLKKNKASNVVSNLSKKLKVLCLSKQA